MHYTSSSAIAMAIPSLIRLASSSPMPLQPRGFGDITWYNPGVTGNIDVFFSDTLVNLGSCIPWDVVKNNVSLTCENGVCGEGKVDIGSYPIVVDGGGYGSEGQQDVEYNAEGNYDPTLNNALIQLLVAVVQNQTKIYNPSFISENQCEGVEGCVPTYNTATEYHVPTSIGLYQTHTGHQKPGYLQMQFSTVQEAGSGFCSGLATAGSAIAGMFEDGGPIAAGIFTLTGLGCM